MKRMDYARFEQLPNVGPATAGDFRLLGFKAPAELIGQDAYQLHERLCRKTGQRHDPCVIDVFLSVIRFMEGAPARPWLAYTAERKRTLGAPARRPAPRARRTR